MYSETASFLNRWLAFDCDQESPRGRTIAGADVDADSATAFNFSKAMKKGAVSSDVKAISQVAAASSVSDNSDHSRTRKKKTRRPRRFHKDIRAITERLQMTTFSRQCLIDEIDTRKREFDSLRKNDRRPMSTKSRSPPSGPVRVLVNSTELHFGPEMIPSPPNDKEMARIFNRLHEEGTVMSRLRERPKYRRSGNHPSTPSRPRTRPPRPDSAPAHMECSALTIDEIRRQFEEKQRRDLPLKRLTRPTTATSLKRKGVCHYCESNMELAEHWTSNGHCDWCRTEEAFNEEEMEELIQRLSIPTISQKGGLPLCERASTSWLTPILGLSTTS